MLLLIFLLRLKNPFKKNNLVEGTMKLVDEVFIMELLKDLNISKTYAGGSVANTLSTISKLGGKCAFIGSRKNDKYGNLFSNSMEKEKIDLLNKENEKEKHLHLLSFSYT